MKSGTSSRHGGHQDAKKSSITTLPLKSARLAGLPSMSESVKSGAASPISTAPLFAHDVTANSAAATRNILPNLKPIFSSPFELTPTMDCQLWTIDYFVNAP